MRPQQQPLSAVETFGPSTRLIQLGSRLDPTVAAEVARLIDGQLELARTGACTISDLLIDVTAVAEFAPGGLETLLPARERAHQQQVAVHLTGCAGRAHRLPGHVRTALATFDPFLIAAYLEL